jgi:FlaG/FlaF family flagellin (archaellin)
MMNCSIYKAAVVSSFLMGLTAQADLFSFSGINQVISDNDSRGYVNAQTISGMSGLITNISVSVTLSAADDDWAFNGDYFMTLQHDSGYAVLMNRIGKTTSVPLGCDDDGFDVTFDLLGADIHTTGDVVGDGALTGSWGVDGRDIDPDAVLDTDARTATLGSFLNTDANGEWRLFVADMSGGGRGELNSWGLNIKTVPEPTVIALISFCGTGLMIGRRFMT